MKSLLWTLTILCTLLHYSLCEFPRSTGSQDLRQYDEARPLFHNTQQSMGERLPSLGDQVGFGPPIGFPSFDQNVQQYPREEDPKRQSEGSFVSNRLVPWPRVPHGSEDGQASSRFQNRPRNEGQPQRPNYSQQREPSYKGGAMRAPSQSNPTYSHQRPYPLGDPKRPILLKVSRLKGVQSNPDNFPGGPSIFYAPSPDVQYKTNSHRQTPRQRPLHYESEKGYDGEELNYPRRPIKQSNDGQRYRREAKVEPDSKSPSDKKANKQSIKEIDPMMADSTEQDNFWDFSSPFIMFDTYKKEEAEPSDPSAYEPSGNLTFRDSTSEEQRFFPSFPSPYLGLSPFSAAPARAPIFPGPAANRAPSRYHPSSFGGTNKYSQHPNRGPSSVAASPERYQETNLLGSGNFEVVRGGTYYADEEDQGPSYHHGGGGTTRPAYHEDDDSYFHHNNGHSSPYRGGGGDFFANFRDFADINPHSRSYSHNHETLGAASELSTHKKVSKNVLDNPTEHQPQFSLEYDPMIATF